MNGGFTLVEMVVVFAVAAIMATVGLFGFGDFGDRVRLDIEANDMLIFIKSAQSYGVSGFTSGGLSDLLAADPVGVFFDYVGNEYSRDVVMFRDMDKNFVYDVGVDEEVDKHEMPITIKISKVGFIDPGASCYNEYTGDLFVSYKRPVFEAFVYDENGDRVDKRVFVELSSVATDRKMYVFIERTGLIMLAGNLDFEGC